MCGGVIRSLRSFVVSSFRLFVCLGFFFSLQKGICPGTCQAGLVVTVTGAQGCRNILIGQPSSFCYVVLLLLLINYDSVYAMINPKSYFHQQRKKGRSKRRRSKKRTKVSHTKSQRDGRHAEVDGWPWYSFWTVAVP